MTTTGKMRALDEKRGAVRVEELYDTDISDLWEACTSPERLARWLAEVSGDLKVGGTIEMTFTSTWTGPARIEVRRAASPTAHHRARHRGRGSAGGVVHGGGFPDPTGRGGAWLADRQAPLPRRRMASAPRGPRTLAQARGPCAPRRLVGDASLNQLAQSLGRADA
jgi:uncharacterized protein YndB with AHSA1/START domain